METGIIEIELIDGRIFRITYLNSSQKKRALKSYFDIKSKCKKLTTIATGLHNVSQLETMIKQNII